MQEEDSVSEVSDVGRNAGEREREGRSPSCNESLTLSTLAMCVCVCVFVCLRMHISVHMRMIDTTKYLYILSTVYTALRTETVLSCT